ncbi:MAG: tetratricopeptide repeat protein [Verrucomicrobium sp.]|nr:tetratricopeptide repeat protein [Verrucomicrobium sp.]
MRRSVTFLLLLAAPLRAAEAPPAPPAAAKDAKEAARAARELERLQTYFDEGLFEKVDAAAKALVKIPAASAQQKAAARLLQGQAFYYLGQFGPAQAAFEAVPAADAPERQAEVLFWQGEALTGQENWAEAEKRYRAALSQPPPNPYEARAQLGLGWALFHEGNEPDARALLNSLIEAKLPTEAGDKAALILAKIDLARGEPDAAAKTLDGLVQRKVTPGVAFEAAYWRGEIAQQQDRPADAIAAYRKVTDDAKAFPGPLVAKAWFGLGSAYLKTNDGEKAMQALEQAYTRSASEQMKLASFRLYLQSAAGLNRLPAAQARLRDYAKHDNAAVTAAAALLAIASSQADHGDTDEAIGTLEALLTAYPQTDWKPAALFQLGQLYTDQGKPDEARTALQNCLEANPPAGMAREASFRLAEIDFAKGAYAKAAAEFEKAAPGGGPLTEKALFNLLLAQAAQGAIDPFLKTEADFAKAFPQSPLLPRIALEKARLYEKANQPDQARAAYQAALQRNPDAAQKALLLLRLADLERGAQHYDDALKYYNEVATEFPEDPRVAEAAYDFVWVSFLAGKYTKEQARDALTGLAQRFEKGPLGARIDFNLGEFCFEAQDYVGAQTYFEKVASGFPQSDLVPRALYYAGQAATQRKDYAAALKILEKVPADAPGGLKTDARLLQGLIYHLQGRFADAVALFDSVLAGEKSGPRFVAATLRKGNALFAQGGADPTRYELAANTYGTLLSTGQGSFAERNEAAYMRAKCFEKLGRAADALALYLDVLNGREAPAPFDEKNPPPPEMLWRVKAGLDAAALRQATQDWAGAAEVYRRLEALGGPNANDFRDALNRLRRDHFLFDEETGAPAAAAVPQPAPAPATNVPAKP